MMNNKGVTLVELIIVIVIIGIISAFTVPAVGRYLETANKSAVLEDARQVRYAADNYCAEVGGCADGTTYYWKSVDLEDSDPGDIPVIKNLTSQNLLSNFSDGDYVEVSAVKTSSGWNVTLTADADGDFQWELADPLNADVAEVDVKGE